jgi:hypothetical protein
MLILFRIVKKIRFFYDIETIKMRSFEITFSVFLLIVLLFRGKSYFLIFSVGFFNVSPRCLRNSILVVTRSVKKKIMKRETVQMELKTNDGNNIKYKIMETNK